MIRTSIAAYVLLAAANCFAQATVDSETGVVYSQERVIQLPQDDGKMHLSVVAQDNERGKQIIGWFHKNSDLVAIRNQCHFHEIDSASLIFKTRYAKSVPSIPCIRLQSPDGTVVYQISGEDIPLTSEALVKNLSLVADATQNFSLRRDGRIKFEWERNRCPRPNPEPPPQPNDDLVQPVGPDVQPDVEPSSRFPWSTTLGLMAVAALIGGAVSLAHCFKAEFTTKK